MNNLLRLGDFFEKIGPIYYQSTVYKLPRCKVKKLLPITAATATAAAIILSFFPSAVKNTLNEETVPVSENVYAEALAVISECGADTFLIREYDGKIGIFADGDGDPLYVVDVYVFTLPDDIAALIRCGVECDRETLGLLYDAVTS